MMLNESVVPLRQGALTVFLGDKLAVHWGTYGATLLKTLTAPELKLSAASSSVHCHMNLSLNCNIFVASRIQSPTGHCMSCSRSFKRIHCKYVGEIKGLPKIQAKYIPCFGFGTIKGFASRTSSPSPATAKIIISLSRSGCVKSDTISFSVQELEKWNAILLNQVRVQRIG
uniref:Uncharacterized protein n=1 Tax=Glossina pallidipes TaxID=7398 RepID=A0A1A9ZBE7_GLOPL